MSKAKFDLPSFKYENLSNRMERLKHSQNHSSNTNLRSASVDRTIENKPLTRVSSTALLASPSTNQTNLFTCMQDESYPDFENRYCGRVTKNTGIRKYNQRMLKEVGNINKKTPPKYTAPESIKVDMIKNQAYTSNRENCSSPLKSCLLNLRTQTSQVLPKASVLNEDNYSRRKPSANPIETQLRYKQERLKLEPGKIYAREELEKYFGI